MKRHVFLFACLIALVFMHAIVVSANSNHKHNQKKTVFVSIMPQKYFVERIAQDRVNVKVLVKPGASPATYEPKPKQMREMAQANLYFAIGVPFEKVWLTKIARSNPEMRVIHTDHGIEKLPMLKHHHHHEEEDDDDEKEKEQRYGHRHEAEEKDASHQHGHSKHRSHGHEKKSHSSHKTSLKKETSVFKIGNDGHIEAKIQVDRDYLDHIENDESLHHDDHMHNNAEEDRRHHRNTHEERSHKKTSHRHQKKKQSLKEQTQDEGISDPHTWLSPSLVILQSRHILRALQEMDPSSYEYYENNYRLFVTEILQLDAELREIFRKSAGLEFMVFHPAWGYFADAYGLKQIPIEVEGKHPKPSQLKKLIQHARKSNIRVIFVQPQFSSKSADQVAKEIDGRVIFIDPIALDWMQSLRDVAQDFSAALR